MGLTTSGLNQLRPARQSDIIPPTHPPEAFMQRRTFLEAGLAAGVPLFAGFPTADAIALVAGRRRGRPSGPILLDSNENPLGLSPRAREALLGGLDEANRYPGDTRRALIDAIAAHHDVPPEAIVPGQGSTEVLRVWVQAAGRAGALVVVADPTFEDVTTYAGPLGLRVERVPLGPGAVHNLGRMREVAERAAGPVYVFLCNPNNPTATLTPSADIDAWIEAAPERVHFLVDEAYFDYADDSGYRSALEWTASRPNVVVSRTFSKIHAMAGIRLGYGIAHPDTAKQLRAFATRNNVSHLAGVAAIASLQDGDFQRRSLQVNREGRRLLCDALERLEIPYLPSHTNFVMHRVPGELDVYISRMRDHGVLVGRPFPPMLDYNRVSIGLGEEMERFVEVLTSFRERNWV